MALDGLAAYNFRAHTDQLQTDLLRENEKLRADVRADVKLMMEQFASLLSPPRATVAAADHVKSDEVASMNQDYDIWTEMPSMIELGDEIQSELMKFDRL